MCVSSTLSMSEIEAPSSASRRRSVSRVVVGPGSRRATAPCPASTTAATERCSPRYSRSMSVMPGAIGAGGAGGVLEPAAGWDAGWDAGMRIVYARTRSAPDGSHGIAPEEELVNERSGQAVARHRDAEADARAAIDEDHGVLPLAVRGRDRLPEGVAGGYQVRAVDLVGERVRPVDGVAVHRCHDRVGSVEGDAHAVGAQVHPHRVRRRVHL